MASGLKKKVTINMLLGGALWQCAREGGRLPQWTLFNEIVWGEEEDVVTMAAAILLRKGAVHGNMQGIFIATEDDDDDDNHQKPS